MAGPDVAVAAARRMAKKFADQAMANPQVRAAVRGNVQRAASFAQSAASKVRGAAGGQASSGGRASGSTASQASGSTAGSARSYFEWAYVKATGRAVPNKEQVDAWMKRLVAFLTVNFMGVIFALQFAGQIWTIIRHALFPPQHPQKKKVMNVAQKYNTITGQSASASEAAHHAPPQGTPGRRGLVGAAALAGAAVGGNAMGAGYAGQAGSVADQGSMSAFMPVDESGAAVTTWEDSSIVTEVCFDPLARGGLLEDLYGPSADTMVGYVPYDPLARTHTVSVFDQQI